MIDKTPRGHEITAHEITAHEITAHEITAHEITAHQSEGRDELPCTHYASWVIFKKGQQRFQGG